MDHEAFIRAIRADPTSPDHWLVYADWLDEQGDDRAALVRAGGHMPNIMFIKDKISWRSTHWWEGLIPHDDPIEIRTLPVARGGSC